MKQAKIAVINYNAGNIRSVMNALGRLEVDAELTDDPVKIKAADKVIFPGVGEASSTMRFLKKKGLDVLIKGLTQPVLGICLGMQLMCSFTEEGSTECLGIFGDKVLKFPVGGKIPHIGWNTLLDSKSVLMQDLPNEPYCYFVHSYYVPKSENAIAITDYIVEYSSAMHKNNFYACQFHPEKSGDVGEQILRNFIEKS